MASVRAVRTDVSGRTVPSSPVGRPGRRPSAVHTRERVRMRLSVVRGVCAGQHVADRTGVGLLRRRPRSRRCSARLPVAVRIDVCGGVFRWRGRSRGRCRVLGVRARPVAGYAVLPEQLATHGAPAAYIGKRRPLSWTTPVAGFRMICRCRLSALYRLRRLMRAYCVTASRTAAAASSRAWRCG